MRVVLRLSWIAVRIVWQTLRWPPNVMLLEFMSLHDLPLLWVGPVLASNP